MSLCSRCSGYRARVCFPELDAERETGLVNISSKSTPSKGLTVSNLDINCAFCQLLAKASATSGQLLNPLAKVGDQTDNSNLRVLQLRPVDLQGADDSALQVLQKVVNRRI